MLITSLMLASLLLSPIAPIPVTQPIVSEIVNPELVSAALRAIQVEYYALIGGPTESTPYPARVFARFTYHDTIEVRVLPWDAIDMEDRIIFDEEIAVDADDTTRQRFCQKIAKVLRDWRDRNGSL